MPPKAAASAAAAAAAASMSDLEDDLLNSELIDVAPTKPVINRTVVKKSTKARAPAAASAAKAAPKKAAARTKAQREALKDRTNTAEDNDVEAAEESGDDEEARPKPKKSRTVKQKMKEDVEPASAPAKKAPRATKAANAAKPAPLADDEIPETQVPKATATATATATARKTKTKVRAPSVERAPTIPETQADAADVSHTIEGEDDSMDIDRELSPPPPPPPAQADTRRARSSSHNRHTAAAAVPPPPPPPAHVPIPPRARSTSVQARNFARSRAGSVSDNEKRLAETEVRKQMHDMKRKYEDMRLKYESLQELAHNAAESNFDKLKKASDQKAKDANDLVASLKKELAEIRKSSSNSTAEAARLHSHLATLQTENEKLKDDAKAAQSSLLASQNEVKSLTAKLDAARKAIAAPPEKVPGSAVKPSLAKNQTSGDTEAAKLAAMKVELYCDLTGLIINSIKRKDGEDEYSCIQTGRNGTLHFHLTISNDSAVANPKTPSGVSYEDAEFAYEPLLDDDRDRDLIDILPDYLADDIYFPRNHAVRFYSKIVDSMTKKHVIEDS